LSAVLIAFCPKLVALSDGTFKLLRQHRGDGLSRSAQFVISRSATIPSFTRLRYTKARLSPLDRRLIPLTQSQLYVVCLKPGALKVAPIRSGERWGADARWRSFSKNFPDEAPALCFFRHDGGRTGLFVPHAAEDALLP
jgi:hypothetical protein